MRARLIGVTVAVLGALAVPAAAAYRVADCPASAITCVEVTAVGHPGGLQPVTFGQPFAPGNLPAGSALMGRDDSGHVIALQIDQPVRHPDGSVRFAVLSSEMPDMADGESRVLALERATAPPPSPVAASPAGARPDLAVDLGLRSPQVTTIVLGNRNGHEAGIPFQVGETVALRLGGEAGEVFTITVAGPLAGGSFDTLTKLAEAMVRTINSSSTIYRAFKGADSYERFSVTTAPGHDQAFDVAVLYSGRAKVSVNQEQTFRPSKHYRAALAAGMAPISRWLNGPVVQEEEFLLPLLPVEGGPAHPHLAVRLHLRRYLGSGAVRAQIIVENDWAYELGPRNWSYAATIRFNGAQVFHRDEITHYHHARWHAVAWSNGESDAFVRHSTPYLLKSGLVPHYDEDLSLSSSTVDDALAALKKSDTGPMGTALVTTFMPTSGARVDIGPLPGWAVTYLLSMDPGARRVLMANADAGAGMPIHFRDKRTDLPVSLDDHPGLTTQFGQAPERDAFPAVTNGDTPWTPEVAHHPSLFYVPYLVTGDRFYLEEQQFWTTWVLGSVDPNYREGARALVAFNQLRGQAWALRTLGETVAVTPDGHPLQKYFAAKLVNNVRWYVAHYPENQAPGAVSPLGAIDTGDRNGVPGFASPWQQDFLFLAFAQLAKLGIPQAEEVARWLAKFTVGRWINGPLGFCPQMAPAYYMRLRSSPEGPLFADWRTLFRNNRDYWNPDEGCPDKFPFGYPDSPSGYVANSYAMLGVATDLGMPGAREAFNRLGQEAPRMIARFAEDPTWDIVPSR